MIEELLSIGILGTLIFIAIKAEIINEMVHLIYEKLK